VAIDAKGGEVSEQRYDCKNMDEERMKQRHEGYAKGRDE
jgi:hypothetical protein